MVERNKKERIVWGALAFTVALLLGSACKKERPPWAEEFSPDYASLIQPFTLVSLELRNTNSKALLTFDELAGVVRSKFPETGQTVEGENPFPGLFPSQRSYWWLRSWESVTPKSNLPVIWTTIQMREASVFYITATGEMRVEKRREFYDLLDGFVASGAKLSPFKESANRNKPK